MFQSNFSLSDHEILLQLRMIKCTESEIACESYQSENIELIYIHLKFSSKLNANTIPTLNNSHAETITTQPQVLGESQFLFIRTDEG